jgi:hypothetical protein
MLGLFPILPHLGAASQAELIVSRFPYPSHEGCYRFAQSGNRFPP